MSRPYEGTAWRRQRRRILDRDGGMCQLRYDGCAGYADTVHHTRDWRLGPANDDDLIAACASCNHKAGSPASADPTPNPPRTSW